MNVENTEQRMSRNTLFGTALGALLLGGLALVGKGHLGCWTVGIGSLGGALIGLCMKKQGE